jgi:2-deoxy-D-gluconate 3-dehydrogenase
VTGGTRGIGAKIALALSKAGADLILVQRNTTNTATLDAIKAEGGKADIVVCDLADKASVEKLIPHVTGELGRTLDIVINCGTHRAILPANLPRDASTSRPSGNMLIALQAAFSVDTRWRTSPRRTGTRSFRST